MQTKNKLNVKNLVGLAMMSAIVIVLQLTARIIPPIGPFSVSLVLIPIVLGAALYGYGAGAWLGFVFALTVMISGDANAFLAINPVGTVITVFGKGILAGLCSGVVYRLIAKKNQILAVLAASVACPVVNTGVFVLGCLAFFVSTIKEWAVAFNFGDNWIAYLFIGMIGANFLFELGTNIILNPVIHTLIRVIKKNSSKK